MVSPVRIRVPPLLKVLQIAVKRRRLSQQRKPSDDSLTTTDEPEWGFRSGRMKEARGKGRKRTTCVDSLAAIRQEKRWGALWPCTNSPLLEPFLQPEILHHVAVVDTWRECALRIR